jgi:hypothetical protein
MAHRDVRRRHCRRRLSRGQRRRRCRFFSPGIETHHLLIGEGGTGEIACGTLPVSSLLLLRQAKKYGVWD